MKENVSQLNFIYCSIQIVYDTMYIHLLFYVLSSSYKVS